MEKKDRIYTRKQLIILIWPLLIEQFLSVSMGFADTFMVSGVSEAAVSSVSLVDSVNIMVIQILAALSTGGAVVVSQYIGSKEKEEAVKSAAQLYSVLLIVTCIIMGFVLCFSRVLLRAVFGQITDEVMNLAQIYFCISAVSYPFIGLYNAAAALFRAEGNSKISMEASLVMNVINIAGNAFLIYVCKLGVLGAAMATLVSRIAAGSWIMYQNQKKENFLCIYHVKLLIPKREKIRKILLIGIPSGIENGMFQIGKLCVSSLVSTLGTAAIAANAVANSITNIANIPGNTMSLAVIPIVGVCLGAGEKKQAKKYANLLMYIAFFGVALTNLILFIVIPEVSGWFHLSKEAETLCINVVRWFDCVSIFLWAASFTLPNILRTGGDARFTMVVSIGSMWFCRVILSYFLVLYGHMGLLGVWIGMFCDWLIRGVLFVKRLLSGKWMEHKII